jgi:hypothetical protein
MQRAINTTIQEKVFSMLFAYNYCRITDVFSMGPHPVINQKYIRVEAGSNTSTVTLRVVGGDERGVSNLKE